MPDVPAIQGPQAQLPDVTAAKREKEVRETAQQFEGVFIGEMTKLMLESVPENEMFGGGNAERIFTGLMAEQMGTAIAQKGGIGLAPNVMHEIIKMQGGQ